MAWPLQTQCNAFYGDPRSPGGNASAKWEAANLTTVVPPYRMTYDGKPIKGIRVHKKCAESLKRCLEAVWVAAGKKQSVVDGWGASIYGGAYNFRLKRGGTSLSMHSWGCAIDLDPARNGFGDKTPAMPREVIAALEAEGWEWGGHWSKPDGMHFQAARTRAVPATLKPDAKPAKPKPELLPKPINVNRPLTEPEIREAQDLLRKLGYTDVGETDGVWGANSKGALTKFCDANRLAYKDPPTIALLWAMQGKDKPAIAAPVSPERRGASPKKVEDIAPEAKTAKDTGWWATVDAGIKAFAAGASVYIASAAQTIVDNKETILVYGGWAVALVIAGSIAVSYYQKRKAASIVQTVTAAVQDGDRFRSAGQ